ncbi:hypothetical protein C8035_v007318 [Colletotrichum spinosum]|uniref:gamma-glutamylcyclotransferase n=1 Tax=Colletotrichum spinosum TaxID=1347390 RepID=A0A4R8QNH3_9PEZI|nr:hypothetical protein C8035_v007318 [Colletotrichum spinosum]
MTLYFAYGSNLSPTQMAARCPGARLVGLAYLPGYEFIINERQFANVVVAATGPAVAPTRVYGVLYTLTQADEDTLDRCEGVPWAYEKQTLPVVRQRGEVVGEAGGGDAVSALVYVDAARTAPGRPREEYVGRMNRGIAEAGAIGLPAEYVRAVLRAWIPEPEGGGGAEGIVDPFL